MMDSDKGVSTNAGIEDLVHIVNNHLNPMKTSPNLSSTRIYISPLMGTPARTAKRRVDGDTGPIRIEGTDTYNQQLQHHYQNVRHIMEEQQSGQISNVDQSNYSRPLSSTSRDSFDKRYQSPLSTYDSPPHEKQQQQQPKQKIVTTITTTTEARPTLANETSSSIDRLIEQSTETTNIETIKNDSQQPHIIERREKYQDLSDSINNEIHRLPTFPIPKTSGGATDLDQVQAQIDRFTDDHQAIQQLTHVLKEHNTTITNEYKHLPSQSNTTTSPSNTILIDQTNKTITSEFTVIDALLDNPLGSSDDKQNNILHKRFNDILSNLRNSEYVNLFKNSTTKKILKQPTNEIVNTPVIRKQTHFKESNIEHISISTEKTPLLNTKEKKKQDKINKKKTKSKNIDYQVIDAIISSPISFYLPDSYLLKYKVTPPLSQLSSIPSITSTVNGISMSQQLDTKANNETVYNLVKIINDLFLHHATALTLAGTTPKKELQKPVKPGVLNELVYQQQPKQQPMMHSNQFETQLQSESIKPRILYRYIDEQGNVLKLSSTPPSQLREVQPERSQQYSYRNTEPIYNSNQQITRDNEQRITKRDKSRLSTTITKEDSELKNRHISQLSNQSSELHQIIPEQSQQYSYRNIEPTYIYDPQITRDDKQQFRRVPEYEQRLTRQDELRLPITIAKDDLELKNKYTLQINEKPLPTVYNIPISIEHQHTIKTPTEQQRIHNHSNQQNASLTRLPLSYQLEQQHIPTGSISYDTDSSISEQSPMYRTYEYVPIHTHYHHPHNRPTLPPNTCYHNHLPCHTHHPCPPSVSYINSNIIPEYSNTSCSRNYIEIFRDGETIPSEVYSLPINELTLTNYPHICYDQYEKNIPPTSNRDLYDTHTIETSPNRDNIYFDNYLPQSKSFDYRPLRTKLQREHKITPRLLVEEWDSPQASLSTDYNKQISTSSIDEVFINNNNQINKA